MSRPGAGTFRRRSVGSASWLAGILLALSGSTAGAQTLRPWVPPGTDSLVVRVAEAKLRFQRNLGDSIGGENYRAYEMVGNAGRSLLRAMGRENMIQARAIEAVLDSLGLDTDIAVEPELPYFAFLMVRNPFRPGAKAVGFLYWYKGADLRMQGVQFAGGHRPLLRVWWTGNQDSPYSWGIVDFTKADAALHFTLLRLIPSGDFWTLVQYEDTGYKLGGSGSSAWADINGDRRPELLAWMPGERDSLFDECKNCPKLVTELTFAERPEGFALMDSRIVPSPYSTLELFVRLLADGNRTQAARLLADPSQLARAIAAGWNARRPRAWKVEYAEPGSAWPTWLMVSFRGAQGARRYTFHFELRRGRWVIHDWVERSASTPPPKAAGP